MRGKALLGLGAGLAAAAGLGAFNRSVTLSAGEVEPTLPFEPTYWKWRYGNVAVYQAGDPSNPPLLLLHGHNAAASAFEMRYPFSLLSGRYHVYALDLLGYGLSDRPAIDYTPHLYMELIEDLLREVVQRPATVIASSLSAAHAIEVAFRLPEWITSLVLFCPTGLRRLTTQSPQGKVIEALVRTPLLGEALFNGLVSRPSLRYYLQEQIYFDPKLVTTELVEQYYNTSHAPGARYAPAAFASGTLYWDANEAWTRLEQPVLIIWGREATVTPYSDAAVFLATNPAAQVQEINHAGILPHDEQPEQVANIITEWLGGLKRGSETWF
ncbi:MAG: alpha/beta fold hydrolase [Chloroflexota bacterium]|nr:alpha/beta fold hydrolase [Chloroflexota bacterium]